jgi:hypothetical protein
VVINGGYHWSLLQWLSLVVINGGYHYALSTVVITGGYQRWLSLVVIIGGYQQWFLTIPQISFCCTSDSSCCFRSKNTGRLSSQNTTDSDPRIHNQWGCPFGIACKSGNNSELGRNHCSTGTAAPDNTMARGRCNWFYIWWSKSGSNRKRFLAHRSSNSAGHRHCTMEHDRRIHSPQCQCKIWCNLHSRFLR